VGGDLYLFFRKKTPPWRSMCGKNFFPPPPLEAGGLYIRASLKRGEKKFPLKRSPMGRHPLTLSPNSQTNRGSLKKFTEPHHFKGKMGKKR